jgi:hypothetical protein
MNDEASLKDRVTVLEGLVDALTGHLLATTARAIALERHLDALGVVTRAEVKAVMDPMQPDVDAELEL